MSHNQRAWDGVVVGCIRETLFSGCVSSLDRARFLAACAPHFGDWLNAIPIQSCGLLLNDDEVRIAVGLRMGLLLFLKHDCVCGDVMDTLGLHGLACKSSAGKQARLSSINDPRQDPVREGTSRTLRRWPETWWCVHHPVETRQECYMGRDSRWHIRHFLYSDAAVCAGKVAERAAAKEIAKYAWTLYVSCEMRRSTKKFVELIRTMRGIFSTYIHRISLVMSMYEYNSGFYLPVLIQVVLIYSVANVFQNTSHSWI